MESGQTGVPLWGRETLNWNNAATWHERMSVWLAPWLSPNGMVALETMGHQDICQYDFAWREDILEPHLSSDLETVRDALADDLMDGVVRVYHGCRVDDAGIYHRDGLRRNSPADMEALVRHIVGEEDALDYMRSDIDRRLAEFEDRERDEGKLYVSLDDREQLDRSGHYALFGPEWLQVFFSFQAFDILRKRGVPTILKIDLPLSDVAVHFRRALADDLLNEWTRRVVNRPDWIRSLNFTIILRDDLPPDRVVGHYHPEVLKSPYHRNAAFKTEITSCPSCASSKPKGDPR